MLLFSCSKEQPDLKTNSIVNADGQISITLVNDPLFKKLDQAFYDMNTYSFTHKIEKIDNVKLEKIKSDIKNKKIVTLKDLDKVYENAATPEFINYKKSVAKILFLKNALFMKYPELKKIPTPIFSKFFIAHKTNSFSKDAIKQITINKNK